MLTELAIWIARKFKSLCNEKDADNMTLLQLLACNPLPFQFPRKGWLKHFIDSRKFRTQCSIILLILFVSGTPLSFSNNLNPLKFGALGIKNNNEDEDSSYLHEVASMSNAPRWNEILEKGKRYNAAVELAKLLIENDTSWNATRLYVKDEEDVENSEAKNTKTGDSKNDEKNTKAESKNTKTGDSRNDENNSKAESKNTKADDSKNDENNTKTEPKNTKTGDSKMKRTIPRLNRRIPRLAIQKMTRLNRRIPRPN